MSAAGVLASPEENAELLRAGKNAVESLKPLAPGGRDTSYFAIHHGPDKIVGYVVAWIEASREKTNSFYQYATETMLTTPGNVRIHMLVSGKLRPNFEPIELEIKKKVKKPRQEMQEGIQRAKIEAGKVTLGAEGGAQKVSREARRPKAPFVYGIETLAQRLDLRRFDKFALREFNMTNGAAGRLRFTVEPAEGGESSLVVREPYGEVIYQFWYDSNGEMLRWGEPSHPILFIKTTKEQVAELREYFQRRWNASGN